MIGAGALLTRTILFSLKNSYLNEKKLNLEFGIILFFNLPVTGLVWVLVIVDPGNVGFYRYFDWNWLFGLLLLSVWLATFGIPFWYQMQNRTKKVSNDQLDIGDMRTMCSQDPELKKKFHEYAQQHYVVESINFIDDVTTYKSLYFEKVRTCVTYFVCSRTNQSSKLERELAKGQMQKFNPTLHSSWI